MKELFLLLEQPTWFSLLFNGFRVFFPPGAKRPDREITRSDLFISEVKKDWSNTFTPLYSSHGTQTAIFRLCSLLLPVRATHVI